MIYSCRFFFFFFFLVILWSIYTNIKVLFIDWAFRAWVTRQLSEAPDMRG